jgi:hypothetical protein
VSAFILTSLGETTTHHNRIKYIFSQESIYQVSATGKIFVVVVVVAYLLTVVH